MKHVALIFVVLVLWATALARDGLDRWINATELPVLLTETSVEVRDRNDQLLRAYTVADGLWRLAPGPDGVDPAFVEMLIAYEDKRFWRHGGVDPLAMLRAVGQAVRYGEVISGGSTLTMQVARLLEDGSTGRWSGKLRQMRVAMALERRLSKQEILNLYFLHAPYGGNLEGIRAASLAYFGKEPTRLTPAQAALLIALPQSPVARRPDRFPDMAAAARSRVLDRLQIAGVLDASAVTAAETETLPVLRHAFPAEAAHIADRARRNMPEVLTHRLTLDGPLQAQLETLSAGVVRNDDRRLSIAILVADHKTGEILASVGSAGFSDQAHRQGFIDMTQAVRSPGSTLKPLVYGLAFDQGLAHPETLVNDRPMSFSGYAPQNFDGVFRGELSVTDALKQSLNLPVVAILDRLGPAHLTSAMIRAGMAYKLPGAQAGLAVGLGGVGVSLEDLVRLYAGIARGGTRAPFHWRAGTAPTVETRFLNPVAAWQLGHILSDLTPPPGAPIDRIAYKTGTSYGHRDAWAIGFDGQHVAGVWIGRADGTPVPGIFGGDLAAPVLFDVFQRIKPQANPLPPPPHETLLVATAQLPLPLQRFQTRDTVTLRPADSPKLAFPPDGAHLAIADQSLVIKVRDGALPLTVLVNGAPKALQAFDREIALPTPGPGYSELTVVDAAGLSDRVTVFLE